MIKIDIKAKTIVNTAVMYAVVDKAEGHLGRIIALYPEESDAQSYAEDYDGLLLKCQVLLSDVEVI